MTAPIRFYSTKDEDGWMSNFFASPIVIGGKTWATTEHYFQAQKFAGTPHEEELRLAKSPMVVARMGRARSRPLRADWERVKDDVMLEALRAKFSQHPGLKSRLLATGQAPLVEHTRNDRYWADGGDGTGRNRLGELLMQVREELRRS
jgi:N-glycosidase YbiA